MVKSLGKLLEIRKYLLSESGSLESGLVMIPLLILFLSVLQLPISTLSRVAGLGAVQNEVNLRGFLSAANSSSSSIVSYPLAESSQLLVLKRKLKGISVTPLLNGSDEFTAISTSIDENGN